MSDVEKLLREKVAVCERRYDRFVRMGDASSVDEIEQRELEWVEAKLELARYLEDNLPKK